MGEKRKKVFEVQIPTEIVRSSEYTVGEFTLLAKLIQAYYMRKDRKLTLQIDHRALMFYLTIKDNKTFKEHLKGLHKKKVIGDIPEQLPRKGALEITLNKEVIPELNKKGYFTQMPTNVLSKQVLDQIGSTGVRILYYYKSHVNTKEYTKQFCFVAEETTAEDLGIAEKTVIKYNKILEKNLFVKIDKHKSENEFNYKDKYVYHRYNNHYTIRQDKIDQFYEKSSALLA